MLRADGFVKVLDFGLAKLVHEKPIIGSADFASGQSQTAQGVGANIDSLTVR